MADEGSCVSLAEELIVSIEGFQKEVAETQRSGRSSLWARALLRQQEADLAFFPGAASAFLAFVKAELSGCRLGTACRQDILQRVGSTAIRGFNRGQCRGAR